MSTEYLAPGDVVTLNVGDDPMLVRDPDPAGLTGQGIVLALHSVMDQNGDFFKWNGRSFDGLVPGPDGFRFFYADTPGAAIEFAAYVYEVEVAGRLYLLTDFEIVRTAENAWPVAITDLPPLDQFIFLEMLEAVGQGGMGNISRLSQILVFAQTQRQVAQDFERLLVCVKARN